jgi:DNA-binding LytR/AlgR family response regulator
MIKTLLADDEKLPLMELRYILENFPQIEIVGEARSGQDTIEMASRLNPKLLFLDIRMGDMNGLEVARRLQRLPSPPRIIFSTAYDQYAVKAFETNALDYILKPYSDERVALTINKVMDFFTGRETKNIQSISEIERLAINTREMVIIVETRDILYIESMGKDVIIKTVRGEYTTRCSMAEMESRLNPKKFYKCHRSYIINLEKVTGIIPWFNGCYKVKLSNSNAEIPVSRKYIKNFRNIMNF